MHQPRGVGCLPADRIIQDPLAFQHFTAFLSDDPQWLEAQEDLDVILCIDSIMRQQNRIRSNHSSATKLQAIIANPDSVLRLRGVKCLETAMQSALSTDARLSACLLFLLLQAALNRVEQQLEHLYRSSPDWEKYQADYVFMSASSEQQCRVPITMAGILQDGFAVSRLLRFSRDNEIGYPDVLLVLELVHYERCIMGVEEEPPQRQKVLDMVAARPKLSHQGVIEENQWEELQEHMRACEESIWKNALLMQIRALAIVRLETRCIRAFVASQQYGKMLGEGLLQGITADGWGYVPEVLQAEMAALYAAGVEHLVFDFDQTLVAEHVGKCTPISDMQCVRLTEASASVVRAALATGMAVAVATFQDDSFGSPDSKVHGQYLIRQVLSNTIGWFCAARVGISAAYPDVMNAAGAPCSCGEDHEIPYSKHYHFHELFPGIGTGSGPPCESFFFFDDNQGNALRAMQEFSGLTAESPYDNTGFIWETWQQALEKFGMQHCEAKEPSVSLHKSEAEYRNETYLIESSCHMCGGFYIGCGQTLWICHCCESINWKEECP